MRLKWTNEELRYFSKPIKKAERVSDWSWWLLMVIGLSVVIWAYVSRYGNFINSDYGWKGFNNIKEGG